MRYVSNSPGSGLTGLVQYHQSVIDNTRAAEKAEEGRPLAIALDTKGPEIRTGNTVGDQDIPISAGHEMIISTDDKCIYSNQIAYHRRHEMR